MNTRHLNPVLTFGLVLIVLLMLLLTTLSTQRMASIKDELDQVANLHQRKTSLLTDMRRVVSARSLAMYNLYFNDDPFRRDEIYMDYLAMADHFVAARDNLLSLPLTREERDLLTEAFDLIRTSQPLRNHIVDSLMADQAEDFRRQISDLVLPLENRILDQFDHMVAVEKNAIEQALASAQGNHAAGVYSSYSLGAVVVFISCLVGFGILLHTRRSESALFRAKEQAEVTLQAIADGVITTDAHGHVVYLNPVAETLTGWPQGEALHRPLQEVCHLQHEMTGQNASDLIYDQLNKERQFNFGRNLILINRDGEECHIEGSTSPLRDRKDNVVGMAVVIRNITEALTLETKLRWQAEHDALTGLKNRAKFEQELENMITCARANHSRHSLLYIDLDQFKIINDTACHSAGDEFLKQLAKTLSQRSRNSDILARLGGDEFGLLLDNCPRENAERIARQELKMIEAFAFPWQDHVFHISASIGVVEINRHSESMAEVLSTADSACYLAKEQGRNRVYVHRHGDSDIHRHRDEMQLTQDIRSALQHDRFVIYKQAISAAGEQSLPQMYELLIRMTDEEGQLIPPMSFIPAAERFGLMPNIDRWMINTAFRLLASQPCLGHHNCIYTINLSALSLGDDDFLGDVIDALKQSSIDPRKICFEITETCAIANWDRANQLISALKNLGCRFALDDFGSGMSSFNYLQNLTVDYIKIDGSLVRRIADDRISLTMVEAIHSVSKALGVQTIAEFVENEAILERLRGIGVHYAQGYAIDKPGPLTA